VALYASINFVAFIALSHGGTPEVRDGAYALSDHGRLIRTLTADEYRSQQVYIARGFSGHWIAFLLLPLFYFLFREETPGEPASNPPAV